MSKSTIKCLQLYALLNIPELYGDFFMTENNISFIYKIQIIKEWQTKLGTKPTWILKKHSNTTSYTLTLDAFPQKIIFRLILEAAYFTKRHRYDQHCTMPYSKV